MNRITIKMIKDECWWGGSVAFSHEQPYDEKSCVKRQLGQEGVNQSSPLYVSSKGRYIHADSPLFISFDNGIIIAEGENVECTKSGDCLKDAYLGAKQTHFPFEKKEIPEKFFRTAQYNTWMEFTYNPTQESVLAYAHAIIDNGYTPGILMIDEGWHISYGTWEFDFNKFPDPKAMIDELHELGFSVMLWIVPFVTLDGRSFLDHYYPWAKERAGLKFEPRLARQKNGKVAVVEWWNGFSAILDLTEENDRKYLDSRLKYLMNTYGVDGFKFDGANIVSLRETKWLTEPPTKSAEVLNKAWNDFGAKYKYHEYKDTYDRSGRATVQRIRDRQHSWTGHGIDTLTTYALAQGLLGYPYICPDMIGGGEWTLTLRPDFQCDEELFVRWAQCSAFFPMMQFSWAPWRMLSQENQERCLKAARLHAEISDKIVALVEYAQKTGEPIIRSMEYCYPNKGYERIVDQFFLGDDLLVCPVLEKGVMVRKVVLPSGIWKYCDGTTYNGGDVVEVSASLDVLPYFNKIK